MRLLVTGGAGFIGSNFIRYIINKNHSVVNIDSLTYAGNPDNLKDISRHKNYRFVRGDISDSRLVESAFERDIDAIVNFAAESHVDRSISNSSPFIKTNVEGTRVLLDAALSRGVRFLQISTDEVYGSLGARGYFTEKTPLSPNNPYSASKAAADLLVKAYYKTYGLPVNITRCSNNYGPCQHPEKLIPLTITNALRDIPVPVYGDGHYIRDWVHVEDHCRAIEAVLQRGVAGEAYNIGGGSERTNIELVKTILGIMQKDEKLISFVKDRPGHDRRYAIDYAKIKRELGWCPLMDFDRGIKETVRWYVENTRWWKSMLREG
ncbi:dTDP-glucose 4,6-dehydratase [Desulfocucumis palustris]|uniref:dTDP-glucose 4,6-dehydratase n=1 Tax=Desulfocucumis palustris TaxID=1898651 RepID=A0A2L2XHR8_9FIRM|nr:dTDP-glucose 4,6-dehydratase [Desulfocucumis palustris]GBF33421.1 dTDP-glucose 4,6-dehydratase [Desulfocucumis palustris]